VTDIDELRAINSKITETKAALDKARATLDELVKRKRELLDARTPSAAKAKAK
jgi:hypothetical protein